MTSRPERPSRRRIPLYFVQDKVRSHEVKRKIALKIIEKLRQDKKNRNILASLNINKRKKEKVQDTIIKQLRIGLLRDDDVTIASFNDVIAML